MAGEETARHGFLPIKRKQTQMNKVLCAGMLSALLLLAPATASLADTPDQAAIHTVMHGIFDKPDVELVIR